MCLCPNVAFATCTPRYTTRFTFCLHLYIAHTVPSILLSQVDDCVSFRMERRERIRPLRVKVGAKATAGASYDMVGTRSQLNLMPLPHKKSLAWPTSLHLGCKLTTLRCAFFVYLQPEQPDMSDIPMACSEDLYTDI